MTKCSVDDCDKEAFAKTWCRTHYSRMRLYGRLNKIKGLEKGNCKVENCNKPVKGRGLCNNHYVMFQKYGRTHKLERNKTKHKYYVMWFDRKSNGLLSDEWFDFWNFAKDIGERPSVNFTLERKNTNKLYGPDNFYWKDKLKRNVETETHEEFNARKWQSRRINFPKYEPERHLKRNFGITQKQYDEMLFLQNGICAICEEKEKAIHFSTGKVKNLAVDHCHNSNKIRSLLCWRCNSMLGKVNESVELLDKMKAYLIKHQTL